HSRPIDTCWKAEIVHSCPSMLLAPMWTSPSCTRTFVPWPIHDQRPRCSRASLPISSVTPGPTKAIPSVTSRPRKRSFSHASRTNNRPYLRLNMPCARRNRSSVSGPPCRGGGKYGRLFVRLAWRSEEHTSELQSRSDIVCRLLLEKKKIGDA